MAAQKKVVVERVTEEHEEQELIPVDTVGSLFEAFCNPETNLIRKEEEAGTLIRYAFCPN